MYLPISFFSWINFTLDSTSADNSMAWLKPFSPPYEISTSFNTFACNLCVDTWDQTNQVTRPLCNSHTISATGEGLTCSATDRVKHVRLAQLGFEVSRTSQDHAGYVDFVVRDKELDCRLRHLAHVVVSLLHSQASKTQGGLASSSWVEKRERLAVYITFSKRSYPERLTVSTGTFLRGK